MCLIRGRMSRIVTALQGSSTRLPANEGHAAGEALAAERLDAIHRNSGALIHDFNNLLGVILSANERLAAELPEGSEAQAIARLALEAAERGAELLRRTLALGRGEAEAPEAVNGAAVLDTVRRLARQAIAPDIRLKVSLPSAPLDCLGDRTGLEMALLNLCLNAGQATPSGGGVFVFAHEVRLSGSDARLAGVTPGDYVAFTVRDTGAGMSPETLARATDPLFTTKSTGTGLGLSAVVDFAAGAGGALSLWSREGQGTTATLYLPATLPGHSAVAA
jgi:signal transduction histidine kinase